MIKAEHKVVLKLLGQTFEISHTDYMGFLSDCHILLMEEGWLDETKVADEVETSMSSMKPTYDHRYSEIGCSMCGNMVGGWEELPNYCPNCGQKID